MKKPLLITIIVLAVLLLLPAVSFLRWAFQEKKPMNVVILDKTVPTLERLGHRSFVYADDQRPFCQKRQGRQFVGIKRLFWFCPYETGQGETVQKKGFPSDRAD